MPMNVCQPRSKDRQKKPPPTYRPPIKTALPYYECTREMFGKIRQHNIRGAARDVFDYLHFHQNIRTGQIHPLTIEQIADGVGCKERTVYIALARLEKAGLYLPEKWGTIKGTSPYQQLHNHSKRQARHEKRLRTFYETLNKRIVVQSVGRTSPLPASLAYKLYAELCKEYGRKDRQYPKVETPAELLTQLDFYVQPETGDLPDDAR